ncbi:MAG: hypothetical protein IJ821_07325 [Lachnospiraceae bacterium]|nr:hypothetical protein [Lachnospiraceae bacterium]
MNFYDVNLAKELSGGGGSQPSGSINISENGTYDVAAFAEAVVNVSGGGGGLEYETGSITPQEDTELLEIPFSNQHNSSPMFFYVLADLNGVLPVDNSTIGNEYNYTVDTIGAVYTRGKTDRNRYGYGQIAYQGTSSTTTSNIFTFDHDKTIPDGSGNSYPTHWCDNEKIKFHSYGSSRPIKAGLAYKWIAIWAPTE